MTHITHIQIARLIINSRLNLYVPKNPKPTNYPGNKSCKELGFRKENKLASKMIQ
jgi:hypothetical protein